MPRPTMSILLLLSLLAAGTFVLACSCFSTPTSQAPPADPIPAWARTIPNEPGIAFYGVGVACYAGNDGAGIRQAEVAAKRQVADMARMTIAAAVRRFIEHEFPYWDHVVEADIRYVANLSRSVFNRHADRIQLMQHASRVDEESGLIITYALAKLEDVEAIVQDTYEELVRRSQGHWQRGEPGVAMLRVLFIEEQLNMKPSTLEYDDSVPTAARVQ